LHEQTARAILLPRRMMTIANGLAAAGIPHVVEMLRDGDQDALWNLSEALDKILRTQKAA
jgi:hypothetical protein